MTSLYERSVRAGLRAYKLSLSPYIGQACRFRPVGQDQDDIDGTVGDARPEMIEDRLQIAAATRDQDGKAQLSAHHGQIQGQLSV